MKRHVLWKFCWLMGCWFQTPSPYLSSGLARARICQHNQLQQKLPHFLAKNSTLQPFEHKPKQKQTTPKVHIFQPPSNSFKVYPKIFFEQHFTQKFTEKKLAKLPKHPPNLPTSHPPRLLNKRAIRARRVKRKRRMRRKPPNVFQGKNFWGANNLVLRSGSKKPIGIQSL